MICLFSDRRWDLVLMDLRVQLITFQDIQIYMDKTQINVQLAGQASGYYIVT